MIPVAAVLKREIPYESRQRATLVKITRRQAKKKFLNFFIKEFDAAKKFLIFFAALGCTGICVLN